MKNVNKTKINEKTEFINVLKKFSPGTSIRIALDDIMRAKTGALIVVDKEGLSNITSGGFKINCKFSPQKLVELTKMDGAIILSEDSRKILYANSLLIPKIDIQTKETGTRHQAAERTSKQIETIVIAVSKRKNKITLYFEDTKYILERSSEILRRATETLQILEKQKEILDGQLFNLNVLEIINKSTINDVSIVLQRIEIIKRISNVIKTYLVELGKEGIIVSMRLKELTKNLINEREMILKDYFKSKHSRADITLENMNFDFLIETSNISRILFEEIRDKEISFKGMRILSKTNLLDKDIKILLNHCKTLDNVFNLNKKSLLKIFKNENFINSLINDLELLKEKIMEGKKI